MVLKVMEWVTCIGLHVEDNTTKDSHTCERRHRRLITGSSTSWPLFKALFVYVTNKPEKAGLDTGAAVVTCSSQ